jgi:nucleoid-associated protein Lsr2
MTSCTWTVRKVTPSGAGRGQRGRPAGTASRRERSGDVRAWAKEQGIAVSGRGRIPASVVVQHEAAAKGR